MRMHAVMILAAGLLISADKPREDKKDVLQKELDRFQGVWTVEGAEVDGKKIPASQIVRTQIIFKGDQMIRIVKGKPITSAIKLDPTQKPRAIDILIKRQEETIRRLGIYMLDDDTLTIVTGRKKRPTAFKTKPKSNTALVIYKRLKK